MANYNNFRGLDKSLRLQKIIDVSIDLFHKKGYKSTTLDDVSKELGVTKAALYHYVSSKENLLSIIFIQGLEYIFKNIKKITSMDITPDKKMRLLIRNHIKEIIIKSLPLLAVFFAEEIQLSGKDYKKIQDGKKKYNQIIEDILTEGIQQGFFIKCDPQLMTFGIIGMCNWIHKWYKHEKTPYTPDQIADHFINILEAGYIKKEKGDNQAQLTQSSTMAEAYIPSTKENALKTIKSQCKALINLIEQVEHT
jgi:AcrR family transcriptional regulator